MRIHTAIAVVTLSALSPGCALPCVALHNIRVETGENWEEHMAGIRAWWHWERVSLPPGPSAAMPDPGPPALAGQEGSAFAVGPPILGPPTPDRGNETPGR